MAILPPLLLFGDSLVEGIAPLGYDVTCACHPGATTRELTDGFPTLTSYLNE
jgi:hypothetical protein